MPNFGGSRLGFWFLQRLSCDALPTILPDVSTGKITGLTEIAAQRYEIQNEFLKVSLNGNLRGAIGSGGNSPNLGIRFDPAGSSNFNLSNNIDEFVERGTVHEGFGVEVSDVGGTREDQRGTKIDNIISGNELFAPYTSRANVYSLGTNHYLFKLGSTYNTKDVAGIATVQYKLFSNEPVIRMKMTYTNTTTSAKFIRMYRAMDPDQDQRVYFTYNTENYRGYDRQPITDLVYALGQRTGKAISIYIPGNGYTHNTNILTSWPTYDPDRYLYDPPTLNYPYPLQNVGDYAIGVVWKIGILQPGQSSVVCCYYIFGNNVSEIVNTIEGRG